MLSEAKHLNGKGLIRFFTSFRMTIAGGIVSPHRFLYIGTRLPGVGEKLRGGIPTVVSDVSIRHINEAVE